MDIIESSSSETDGASPEPSSRAWYSGRIDQASSGVSSYPASDMSSASPSQSSSSQAPRPVVLFTAFEPSGDALAAPVIRALRKARPDWEIYAWGGPKMAEAGANMAGETSKDGAMGLGAILKAGEVRSQVKAIKRWMKNCRLMVHVPVDSPAANFPICAVSRKAGAKVVHLAAPQMWAWGAWRVGKLRKLTDLVLCLLPFEPAWFEARGVKCTFVGHPAVNRDIDIEDIRMRLHGLPQGAPRITLFPGSRTQEVRRNLGLMADFFEQFRQRHSGAAGLIVAASDLAAERVQRFMGEFPHGMSMVTGMRDEAIAWADLSIAVSGTVTLDLMRQCAPMIGVYKVSTPTYLAAKVLLRSQHRLLPNLIGDRRIVPEFVPYCRGPGPLVDQALWLLDDSRRLAAQRQGLRQNLSLYKGHSFGDECVEAITKVVGR